MKFETTRKRLLDNYGHKHALAVGYCDAAYLLKWTEPNAYTHGVYGWNFDAYTIGDILITTGYRNLIGKQARFTSEFEEQARKIWSWDNADDYDTKKEKCRKLCLDWIKKEFEALK